MSDENDATTRRLEQATVHWVDCINRGRWSDPFWRSHLADDFETFFEHLDNFHLVGRRPYVEQMRAFGLSNPDYHAEVIETTVNVDSERDIATVWLFVRIMGNPPGTQKETAIVTYWRRSEGKWVAYQQMGIRSGCFL